MTDRIALVLALIIFAAIMADVFLNGSRVLLFLALKLVDVVEYLAIWR